MKVRCMALNLSQWSESRLSRCGGQVVFNRVECENFQTLSAGC